MSEAKRARVSDYDLVRSMPVGTWFNHRHCKLDGKPTGMSKANFRRRVRAMDATIEHKHVEGALGGETLFRIGRGHRKTLLEQKRKEGGSATYYLISPQKKQVKVTSIREFCRENNFHHDKFRKLVGGVAGDFDGWKCESNKFKEEEGKRLVDLRDVQATKLQAKAFERDLYMIALSA